MGENGPRGAHMSLGYISGISGTSSSSNACLSLSKQMLSLSREGQHWAKGKRPPGLGPCCKYLFLLLPLASPNLARYLIVF